MQDPYLITDIAHANAEDRAWLKDIALDNAAEDILNDASALDLAVGDQIYGAIPFEPQAFLEARCALGKAKGPGELFEAAKAFQAELIRVARAQAKVIAEDDRQHLEENPYAIECMLLREQAE